MYSKQWWLFIDFVLIKMWSKKKEERDMKEGNERTSGFNPQSQQFQVKSLTVSPSLPLQNYWNYEQAHCLLSETDLKNLDHLNLCNTLQLPIRYLLP